MEKVLSYKIKKISDTECTIQYLYIHRALRGKGYYNPGGSHPVVRSMSCPAFDIMRYKIYCIFLPGDNMDKDSIVVQFPLALLKVVIQSLQEFKNSEYARKFINEGL